VSREDLEAELIKAALTFWYRISMATISHESSSPEPDFPDIPPTPWERLVKSPLKYFTYLALRFRSSIIGKPAHLNPIRIVCISDSHNYVTDVPPGDVLIHAGDMTGTGSLKELQEAASWLQSLPHQYKLVIGGNHDEALATPEKALINWGDVKYLEDEATVLKFASGRVLNVYGSPLSVNCGPFPFQYLRNEDVWQDKIPKETDILITHGPPGNHLDLRDGLGCRFLAKELKKVRPDLHVFGHVHWGHGQENVVLDEFEEVYQRIMSGNGNWMDFGRLILRLRPAQGSAVTKLVNPALVNGDASKLIHEATSFIF
jgi:predicted phosphohydrolase